jgi:hypothetical protein
MGTATVPSPGSADATNAIAEPARGSVKAIPAQRSKSRPAGCFLPGANALIVIGDRGVSQALAEKGHRHLGSCVDFRSPVLQTAGR